MSAENLLLILDECDEINIVLRESFQPAAICALACVLLATIIGWRTGSVALAVTAMVLTAWLGLVASWLLDRPRSVYVTVTPRPPER